METDKETWILYQTTNLVNGKIYVGVHKLADTTKSRNYLGSGLALKIAIEKYGRNNFTRTTLAEFSCAEDAYLAEERMVDAEFVERGDTYNIKIGGLGCKGLALTDEHKAKISSSSKGRVHTAEARAKMSASGKGKVISEEQKVKMRLASKGNKNCLGRVHTPETKSKISASRIGKVHSLKTKMQMSVSTSGAKNYKSISIIINDVYHESASLAAKSEGLSHTTITNRARSNDPKWSEWRLATDAEKAAYASGALE
jgi:group I intron endonuclease